MAQVCEGSPFPYNEFYAIYKNFHSCCRVYLCTKTGRTCKKYMVVSDWQLPVIAACPASISNSTALSTDARSLHVWTLKHQVTRYESHLLWNTKIRKKGRKKEHFDGKPEVETITATKKSKFVDNKLLMVSWTNQLTATQKSPKKAKCNEKLLSMRQ